MKKLPIAVFALLIAGCASIGHQPIFQEDIPRDLPRNEQEWSICIAALKHIAPKKVVDELSHAKANEEKKEIFIKFWLRQDREREKKRIFYSLVAYAEEHFGGVNTMMGKITIRFGPPDAITDFTDMRIGANPTDPIYGDERYEIWNYYALASGIGGRDYKLFIFPSKFNTRVAGSAQYWELDRTNQSEYDHYFPEEIFK